MSDIDAGQKLNAVFRLTKMRELHKELSRAEAQAKVKLAAAIIAWDESEENKTQGIHTLQQQSDIVVTQEEYGQALANLLRGEYV